ncbi:hypothetical protein HMPREF9457_03312, partial [Dorea formicigenerans 4_6_53AFAA]
FFFVLYITKGQGKMKKEMKGDHYAFSRCKYSYEKY